MFEEIPKVSDFTVPYYRSHLTPTWCVEMCVETLSTALSHPGIPGGGVTALQGNGDVRAQEVATSSNGYTCQDCRLLGAHRESLSTLALHHSPGPTTHIYSRDRSQKRESLSPLCWGCPFLEHSWAEITVLCKPRTPHH